MAWSKTKQGQYINKELYGDKVFGYNAARNLQGFDKYIASQKKAAKGSGNKSKPNYKKAESQTSKAIKESKAELRRMQSLIGEIKKINPYFDPPKNLYTFDQLKSKLEDYKLREDHLETIRSVDPKRHEELLKRSRMVSVDNLRNEADRILQVYAGDDTGDVSLRKGATGNLDTKLGKKLTPTEREFIGGMSGTNVRDITETDRVGSKPQIFNAKWNASVQSAANKLEAEGFFQEGDSGVRKPPRYNPNGTSSPFLTNKELWVAERTLDYGHIGSATNPGFHYVMNYDSNGMPEFTLWNRQTSAGMTAAETDVADTRISSGRGYEWDKVNKGRFNKHLNEVLDIITDAEFEELAPTLEYFDSLPESPYHVDDPQRDFITKNPDVNSRPNLDVDSAYLLTNNQNNIALDNHTSSEKVAIRKAAIASRIAFMKSLPTFDLDTALSQGVLPTGVQRNIKVSALEEAGKVDQISDADLQTLRQNVMAEIAKGESLTLDQILRRAVSKMPKAPIALAALVGSFTTAFADAPEGESAGMTALRALDEFESSITKPGANAIMNVADAVGVGDGMRSYDNYVMNTHLPSYPPVADDIMGFAYNMYKDIPSEIAGLAEQFIGSPVGAGSDIVEGQQYYNGPGFEYTNASTIPTPNIVIDEHDAKVNRGLVRNIWTNDD